MKHCFARKPLIICGPSGVGKGTITNLLLAGTHGSHFSKAVSHTTRKSRKGEVEGRDYYFVPHREDMKAMIDNLEFIEYAQVHSNLYGTSFQTLHHIDQVLKKVIVLDIDVNGLKQVLERTHAVNVVGVLPSSLLQLEERLRGRNSEPEESIQERLHAAKEEIRIIQSGNFTNKNIVNEDSWKVGYPLLETYLKEWYPTIMH